MSDPRLIVAGACVNAYGGRPLARPAERTHVTEGTLAQSLLASAIEATDPDPDNVVALLDGIDGAYERAQRGLRQAATGQTTPLGELGCVASSCTLSSSLDSDQSCTAGGRALASPSARGAGGW